MHKTDSAELIDELTKDLDIRHESFEPAEWVNTKEKIALINGEDCALFSLVKPYVYEGHYVFKSRGKAAITAAKKFLSTMFDEYDAKVINGITPLENLGARYLTRKLGFTSYGEVQTKLGSCELFVLTKEEFQ